MKRFPLFIMLALTGVLCAQTPDSIGTVEPQPSAPHRTYPPYHHNYIDLFGGGAVGSLGYQISGGNTALAPAFTVGIGYSYFFLPWMGVQTGAHLTRIASSATLTDEMVWRGQVDGDGDTYDHHLSFTDFRESQQVYFFEVPVGLRFRTMGKRAGLYAAMGAKMAIPVIANYTATSGTLHHSATYPQWNLTLTDIPGRFQRESLVEQQQEQSFISHLRTVNAEAYAELGTTIRLHDRVDLYIAAYGTYMFTNLSRLTADERTPLGFRTESNQYAYMSPYRGLIGSDHVGALHPWSAGLKVGVSIFPGATDEQRQQRLKRLAERYAQQLPSLLPDTLLIRDTILRVDTVYLHDTVYVQVGSGLGPATATETHATATRGEQMAATTVFFLFDKTELYEASQQRLDSVAAYLSEHPAIRVYVDGHTCSAGTNSYNRRLSLRRAKYVARVLRLKGVSPDNIMVRAFGSHRPYPVADPHQALYDRRVEILPLTQ